MSLCDLWVNYWLDVEGTRRALDNEDGVLFNTTKYKDVVNNTLLADLSLLGPDGLLTEKTSMDIYGIIIVATLLTTLIRNQLFMKMCVNASTYLHQSMFTSTLHACMTFFYENPSGEWQKWFYFFFLIRHFIHLIKSFR